MGQRVCVKTEQRRPSGDKRSGTDQRFGALSAAKCRPLHESVTSKHYICAAKHPRLCETTKFMLYNKTPKAWASLAQPALLGRLAHTLVLMANGRRSLRELSLLTGTDITEQAYLLCEAGYLEAQDPPQTQIAD